MDEVIYEVVYESIDYSNLLEDIIANQEILNQGITEILYKLEQLYSASYMIIVLGLLVAIFLLIYSAFKKFLY